MPYAPTNPSLPFAQGSDTSYRAAIAAAPTRGYHTWRYLYLLADHGEKSDQEAADILELPVSSINSIRAGCMPKDLRDVPSTQLVTKSFHTVPGIRSPRRCWTLTEVGRQAVARRREQGQAPAPPRGTFG